MADCPTPDVAAKVAVIGCIERILSLLAASDNTAGITLDDAARVCECDEPFVEHLLWALVRSGFAIRTRHGTYQLAALPAKSWNGREQSAT